MLAQHAWIEITVRLKAATLAEAYFRTLVYVRSISPSARSKVPPPGTNCPCRPRGASFGVVIRINEIEQTAPALRRHFLRIICSPIAATVLAPFGSIMISPCTLGAKPA